MLLLWHFKRDVAVGDVRKGSRGALGAGYQASDFHHLDPSQPTILRTRSSYSPVRINRRNNYAFRITSDWSWQDQPEDIAAAMLRIYSDKAKRLGAALQNASKPAAKVRRGVVR